MSPTMNLSSKTPVHEARSRPTPVIFLRSIDDFITNCEIASRVGRLVLIHGDAIELIAQRGHVRICQNKAVRAPGTLAIHRAG